MKTDFCNEMKTGCCYTGKDKGNNSEKTQNIPKCFQSGKLFLAIPGIFVVSALILGYFLEADIIKVMWMILFGILGFFQKLLHSLLKNVFFFS